MPEDDDDVEVWVFEEAGATQILEAEAPAGAQATKEDAVNALKDLYEDIRNAPNYLNLSPLVKRYNMVRQRHNQAHYGFVLRECDKIKDALEQMKQAHNDMALEIIRIQEHIQQFQKDGLQMDYDSLFAMLDKCLNVLKKGKLASGKRLVEKFMVTFEQQRTSSLAPVKQNALQKLQNVNMLIQDAKSDGTDTELEEHQVGKLAEAVKVATSLAEIRSAVEQSENITELLEFSKSEQMVSDELPKETGERMQVLRAQLFEFTKTKMDIQEMVATYEEVSDMFTEAKEEDDFIELNLKLDELEEMMNERRSFLDQLVNAKKVIRADIEEMGERLQELTYMGYLVASMRNRLEKAEKRLDLDTSETVMKETERLISNLKNELDSVMAQDVNEFNLKMRLLMDFEVLSDLNDQLDQPVEQVEEFLMEFSMMFAEAQSNEVYKDMNESMGYSLKLIKQALGMEVDQETTPLPEKEQRLAELEELYDFD
jgi:hypothetical protein